METLLIIGMGLILIYQTYNAGKDTGLLEGYSQGFKEGGQYAIKLVSEKVEEFKKEQEHDVSDLQENG